jgi:thiol-disulfide isomerase/thioredoxin
MPSTPRPLAALLLAPLLAVSACEGKPQQAVQATTSTKGPPAPAFTGRTLDGEPLELAALQGQVVLLNVWATWCEPCRAEMPELQALHARHRAQGFTVLGVSVDAPRLSAEVRRMVDDFRLTYPNVHDGRNTIGPSFKIVGYPTTFLIDRHGALVWRKDGKIEPGDPELAAALADALADPA